MATGRPPQATTGIAPGRDPSSASLTQTDDGSTAC